MTELGLTKADLLFDELGYAINKCDSFITYTKDYGTHKTKIEFDIEKKLVNTIQIFNEEVEGRTFGQCWNIDKARAVFLKCMELEF